MQESPFVRAESRQPCLTTENDTKQALFAEPARRHRAENSSTLRFESHEMLGFEVDHLPFLANAATKEQD